MLSINSQGRLVASSQSAVTGCSATIGASLRAPRRRGPSHLRAAPAEENFFDNIKRVAKKIQGSLPIIGLVSRLTSSEGGFDALAYPEYCRSVINGASEKFNSAMVDLEKKYGKEANSKWLLLLLWMVKTGTGLVPAKDIISAARRLRVTQDMEIEIDRFDITRSNSLRKYSMIEPPAGKIKDMVNISVDAICTLCIGLKDGEAIKEDDGALLALVIEGAFPEADKAMVEASIAGRPQRAVTYTTSA